MGRRTSWTGRQREPSPSRGKFCRSDMPPELSQTGAKGPDSQPHVTQSPDPGCSGTGRESAAQVPPPPRLPATSRGTLRPALWPPQVQTWTTERGECLRPDGQR